MKWKLCKKQCDRHRDGDSAVSASEGPKLPERERRIPSQIEIFCKKNLNFRRGLADKGMSGDFHALRNYIFTNSTL